MQSQAADAGEYQVMEGLESSLWVKELLGNPLDAHVWRGFNSTNACKCCSFIFKWC